MFKGQVQPSVNEHSSYQHSGHQHSGYQHSGHQHSERLQQPLPRELAVAATMLVVIMVFMGLALWAVAGRGNQQHSQANADVLVELPTSELLQSLADDLGQNATADDLEAAVGDWLQRQGAGRLVLLAGGSQSG